jgi:hypothetical protein
MNPAETFLTPHETVGNVADPIVRYRWQLQGVDRADVGLNELPSRLCKHLPLNQFPTRRCGPQQRLD